MLLFSSCLDYVYLVIDTSFQLFRSRFCCVSTSRCLLKDHYILRQLRLFSGYGAPVSCWMRLSVSTNKASAFILWASGIYSTWASCCYFLAIRYFDYMSWLCLIFDKWRLLTKHMISCLLEPSCCFHVFSRFSTITSTSHNYSSHSGSWPPTWWLCFFWLLLPAVAFWSHSPFLPHHLSRLRKSFMLCFKYWWASLPQHGVFGRNTTR